MNVVLTLVVNPANGQKLSECADAAAESLSTRFTGQRILSDERAVDCTFVSDRPVKALRDTIRAALPYADISLSAIEERSKKLFLADMDSTIINEECIDELASYLGIRDAVSEITERAMRAEIDFATALRERVGLLKGLSEDTLLDCYQNQITLTPGAETLLANLKSLGIICYLVSGGFTFFTGRIAKRIGFDAHVSNRLDIVDGHLTGGIVPPLCDAATKVDSLREQQRRLGLKDRDIIAIGDGANDIPMLEAAGMGVAFCAKPKTEAAADAVIQQRDLRNLLYFLGLSDKDFAS